MAGHAGPIQADSAVGQTTTIYGALRACARARPHAPALLGGESATYEQLLALADADAGRLHGLGVGPGECVVLWLPNGLRWASLFFACARLGVTVVPAGTRLRGLDLRHIMADCRAHALLYTPQFLTVDYERMVDQLDRDIAAEGAGDRPLLVSVGASTSRRRRLDDLPVAEPPTPWADDGARALVCYTSGTTGRPKGCVHSHRTLVRNGTVAAGLTGLTPDDRIVCPVPFAHVFGFHMGVLQAALSGAAVINAEPYSARRVLELTAGERGTVLYAVPAMARELVSEQRRRPVDLSALRLTLVAGAPVTAELRQAIQDPAAGLGSEVSIVYGCSEAPTVTQLVPGDPVIVKLRSVGRATPGVELRICRDGATEPAEPAVVGEILMRGYNQMLEYLGDAAATEAKRRQGWLVTGDMGWMDADGYLYFVGRTTDMFLVGGFNAYPQEIEGQLEQCEAIAEAAVIGVPDARLGAVPMAWVRPAQPGLSEEQVIAWAHSALAGYKRPRYARVVRVLPRTNSGKLSRVKLEQLARRALPQLDWESAER